MDDLGSLLALRLGLPPHGPLHRLGKAYVLHLDQADFDAPRFGSIVDDLLKLLVDLLPMSQQFIQLTLANDITQRRLREIPGCAPIIFDLNNGIRWVKHPEIYNGIHTDRHVVSGDCLLGGNVEGNNTQIHFYHAVHDGNNEKQPRPLGSDQPAQTENDSALILLHNLDSRCEQNDQNDDQHPDACQET